MLHIFNNITIKIILYCSGATRGTNLSSVPFIIMLYKTIHISMNLFRMDYNKTDFVLAFVGTEGFSY